MTIDWQNVRKVLIVRLRSIGDTVLSTPSLIALRRFLPAAEIDILLEDWVAPVLDGFDGVDNVLTVFEGPGGRLKTARLLRRNKYDVALNLHGGTTATFFVRASGAKHRIGFSTYQYSFLYNHKLSSASDFWQQTDTHSAEQQLALLGFVGVPVADRPRTRLAVTEQALGSLNDKLKRHGDRETGRQGDRETGRQGDRETGRQGENPKSAIRNPQSAESATRNPQSAKSKIQNPKSKIGLLHPMAAFKTKQWATEGFARTAEFLYEKGFQPIAIATRKERGTLEDLRNLSEVPILTFDDLTLPEITALASRAEIFVGNDSGIAHIAAAVLTPSVVIFGSSNRNHWRPWTDAPHEVVFEEFPCQPCAGYVCKEFGEPKCILSVRSERVTSAIERVLTGAQSSRLP